MIHLHTPRLISPLGPDLTSAGERFRQGQLPGNEWFLLNELKEPRPYLPVKAAPAGLFERLDALLDEGENYRDCLLVIASTTLDISLIEAQIAHGMPLEQRISTPLDSLAERLCQQHGFAAAFTLNTACTSAANALLYARRALEDGRYERALVIAFETRSEIAQQGFGVLDLFSRDGHYRPFHTERNGLILGEAYASVMLSRTPPTNSFAQLLGGFSACDTSSLTNTREDGSHIEWVMQRALKDAAITPEQIALTKLHGTATPSNDLAESNGIERVFGTNLPPLCALKPFLGHTLGACGLTETLLLIEALRHGPLPANPDHYPSRLPLQCDPLDLPESAHLLLNFFGFGGNNACLILNRSGTCA